ncbi:MAG: RNA polymerase sigma factor [Verrucomicrobiota bacterium]
MQKLSNGDDLALNEIMTRWQQRVFAFILRMTNNPTTACDLAQETFVRLYQSRMRYRPEAAFSSYLFQIASNLTRNQHRWSERHPAQALETLQAAGFDPASDDASPDTKAIQGDTARIVETAIRELPEDIREALVLFTYEDMSYAEIAGVLGCTAKAVETRIYRARQILKAKLSQLPKGNLR